MTNNITNKIIGAIAVLALIVGVGSFFKGGSPVQQMVGSVTGPDLYSPYFTVNGVKQEYRKQGLVSATTTPCAIKSPASTSTLVSSRLNISTGTSTDGLFTLATSSTAFATTTPLFTFGQPANLTRTFQFIASTTNASGTAQTIAPNTYLVFGVAGLTYGYTYAGTCDAIFNAL